MIIIDDKFLINLNLYNGKIISSNKMDLDIDFPVFALFFNFRKHTAMISDLYCFEDWHVITKDLKKEDIQPIIDKYYKKFNNLKAFF